MKKNLLVITPRLPFPVIGGDKLRIFNICKILSKDYNITLLSLTDNKKDLMFDVTSQNVFLNIECVYLSKLSSWINCFFALFDSKPLQVAYYKSSNFHNLVTKHLNSNDVILSHLIRVSNYALDVDCPHFVEMTDAISLNYSRVSKLNNLFNFRSLVYSMDARRTLFYEIMISKKVNASFLVSKVDIDYLYDNGAENLILGSNGVDLDRLTYCFRGIDSKVVAFIGNMTSYQNFDACLYFIESILPLLRQKDDWSFKIVGNVSDKERRVFSKYSNVVLTGTVDSINDAVEDALVGVCCVRLAAGVQNKVLEYMALGLPVVCSTRGLEGLEAIPGNDLLVADNPEDIASCIIKLSKCEKLSSMMSRNGFKYVSRNHDWSVQLEPIRQALLATSSS